MKTKSANKFKLRLWKKIQYYIGITNRIEHSVIQS